MPAHKRKVYQYSVNGEFMKEWESVSSAAQAFNTFKTNISACGNGRAKMAAGYIWLFELNPQKAKSISDSLPIRNYHMDYAEGEWRDVVGYEGLYQVNCNGVVRSLDSRTNKSGVSIMKLTKNHNPTYKNPDNHYLSVSLYKNGKYTTTMLHRIVAMAFIPNPDNLPCVNHKDENPLNNHVDNLEWCTYEYNNKYGTHPSASINHPSLSRPVNQYKDGVLIATYPSIAEARRKIGRNNICACLTGRRKHCGGYEWEYAD